MKRKDKNDLLKQIAESIDNVLVNQATALTPRLAAELINHLKLIDSNFLVDHSKRAYHKAIQDGSLVLEQTIEK